MNKFFNESKYFFRIGFPMLGSQLSFMIMSATDTIVAGRAGADQLAGLVIANSFTYPIFMFMAGIIFSVIPIVAQLNGANKDLEIGQKIREVFWLATLLGLLLVIIFYFGSQLLIFLPIDETITSISISYLKAISIGMFFYILYRLLSSYSEGLTLTIPVFIVVFMGALINIPLDIIFVYGYFGLPEMGGVGCGYATTIVSTLMFVAMLGIVLFSKSYKKNKLFSRFDGPSLKTSMEVFKLGTPIGFGIFVELSMYSGAAIILAPLGENVVSGHAVALNIASIVFMLPLAIGLAASTRVGNLLGEKRYIDARYSSKVSVYLCLIGALFNMTLLVTLGDKLISLYTTDLLVFSVASHLIVFAAIFQIPDGIGMGSLGALRGYKDTFMTMVFIVIAYWVFAIPFGYYLTYYGINQPMGERGMWISMIVGLTIFATLISRRLNKISGLHAVIRKEKVPQF